MLAALLLMAVGLNAQPGRNIRMFRSMNIMRPDSNFRPDVGRRGMDKPGIGRALGLNEDQVKAFKDIHLKMHQEIKPLQNQLGEAEAHQKTLLSADSPNLNAINDNIEKIGEIKIDMAKIRTKYMLETRSKLTDEQRMKLEMMRAHRKFNGPGMQNGHRGPGFGGPGMGMDFGQ